MTRKIIRLPDDLYITCSKRIQLQMHLLAIHVISFIGSDYVREYVHIYMYIYTYYICIFFVPFAIYTFLPHNSIIRHCNFCFKGICVLKTATSICIALSTTFHVGRVFFERAATDLKRRINDIDNRQNFHVAYSRDCPA